jgi:HlyD family secretion protein
MRKRIAIGVVIVLVAVAGYSAWMYFSTRQATGGRLTGSGTIEATEVAVSPLTGGRIVSSTATEGVEVKSGDVLFRIDSSVADAQVEQAVAGVNAAKAARDQAKQDKKSTAEISAAQAQLDQARAQVKLAALQRSYCTVVAPVDGTIVQVAMDAGENASPGKTLAVLARLDDLSVAVYVPESSIGQVVLGGSGTLAIDSQPGTFPCTITLVASQAEFTPSQVETKDQRVKLVYRVELTVSDPSGTLKPGMPADVTFE